MQKSNCAFNIFSIFYKKLIIEIVSKLKCKYQKNLKIISIIFQFKVFMEIVNFLTNSKDDG